MSKNKIGIPEHLKDKHMESVLLDLDKITTIHFMDLKNNKSHSYRLCGSHVRDGIEKLGEGCESIEFSMFGTESSSKS